MKKHEIWCPISMSKIVRSEVFQKLHALTVLVLVIITTLSYFTTLEANDIAREANAQSDLRIDFIQKSVTLYSPLRQDNSKIIYDPSLLNYMPPSPTIRNEIVIKNQSTIKAKSVRVEIRIIRGPFVLCSVFLHPAQYPHGSWSISSFDDQDYCSVTVDLGVGGIEAGDKAKIAFVYSYPLEHEKARFLQGSKNIRISVDTQSQNKSVVKEASLAYY